MFSFHNSIQLVVLAVLCLLCPTVVANKFPLSFVELPFLPIKYKYELCVLTRVKDVSYLLPQWLEYHINAGVDHFYIADDCSTDGGKTMFWAQLYSNVGMVTLYETQDFNDCTNHIPNEAKLFDFLFEKAKQSCEWITVIDADEYMYPSNPQNGILFGDTKQREQADLNHNMKHNISNHVYHKPVLKQIIAQLEKHQQALVRMPWYVMSTQGYESRPPGLLLQAYTHGQYAMVRKTLVKSRHVALWHDSHTPLRFEWSAPRVDHKLMRDYARSFYVKATEFHSETVNLPVDVRAHCGVGGSQNLRGSTHSIHNSTNISTDTTAHNSTTSPCAPPTAPVTTTMATTATCSLPKSLLSIHHFQALSWEDYSTIRAARTLDSTGIPNAWKTDARNAWLGFNFAYDLCSERNSQYTAWVVQQMEKSITRRIVRWVLLQRELKEAFTRSISTTDMEVSVALIDSNYIRFVNGDPFQLTE